MCVWGGDGDTSILSTTKELWGLQCKKNADDILLTLSSWLRFYLARNTIQTSEPLASWEKTIPSHPSNPPRRTSSLFFWKDHITNKMPLVTKTPVIGAQSLLLASSESSQPPLLPCCKCHMSDVVRIKFQRFKWAQGGRLRVINHHNVKDYHRPRRTCFHSPFHTGRSCATKHGVLTSLSLLI